MFQYLRKLAKTRNVRTFKTSLHHYYRVD